MLVNRSIPTLINGVSQQPDELRLPSQAEAQVNYHSSVVEGLSDRPPTQHIAQLYSGAIGDAYPHIINRDSVERYVVLFRNGDLTVHDLAGNVKTVSFPNGKTYLNTATPSTTMKAMTVSDYTFVLNTSKVPAMSGTLTTTRAKEALIFVKQGAYGSNYTVHINGVQQALKATSTTSVLDIDTVVIATSLRTQLVTNLGAGWTITQSGSCIHVVKDSGDFTIKTYDSQAGASLHAFKDSTQSFTSLPSNSIGNFEIKIEPELGAPSYYVKFTSAAGSGEGVWEETVGQGRQATIDPANMPHVLIRNVDGTFTFQQATWDVCTVGDTETAPVPSFIGKAISEVLFFKNRLGILAGDSEVYSEVGGYFNFWPTTVTADVDSDPIDYQVSHTKVPSLKNSVSFAEKLLLFSEQTQFIAQGTPTFTKKTLQTDSTTEFESRTTCKPVGIGKNAYFAFNRDQFDGIREYFIEQTVEVKDAVDITAQVPKYIPAGVFRLMPTSTEDMLIALTSGHPEAMYVYKFFYAKDEKLQSAWSYVTLGAVGTKVLGGDFVGSTLYLAIQRADGVYLEKMIYAPGVVDPGVNYVTHYDRRLTEAQVSIAYDGGTGLTTWTLPYALDGTFKIVTREVSPGQVITLTYTSGTTVRAAGDYTTTKVYLGQTYLREYIFSRLYLREQKQNTEVIITSGRLQLRTASINYSKTGTFSVQVLHDEHDPVNAAIFTGRLLGAGANIIGTVSLASGDYSFPILAKNTKVKIRVYTDSFLPSRLLSMEWEGFYHVRSRRS